MKEIDILETFDWCLIGKIMAVVVVAIGFIWLIKKTRISLSWIINKLLNLKFGHQALFVSMLLVGLFLALLSPVFKVWLTCQSYFSILLCLPLASCLISFLLLVNIVFRRYKNRAWTHKLLGCMMFCLWSVGWIVMYLTYYIIITKDDPLIYNGTELLVKSAFGATKLFAMDAGATLFKQIESYELLRDLIAFISLAGFACMMALVISLVFSRLGAWIRLRNLHVKRGGRLYVFFGSNTASEQLLTDTRSFSSDATFIFVETNLQTKDDEGTSSWGNFKKVITHRRKTFDDICRRAHALLTIADRPISSIALKNDGHADEDILTRAGLEHLATVIKRMSADSELHLFFLSDNEDDNVRSILTMTHDSNLQEACEKGVNTTIYCHARYENVNSVVEDQTASAKMHIRIVDSSHLAVESLREDDRNLPIEYVKLSKEKPGTVDTSNSQAFTCMVIGLSETGCDATRFLYEHSALLDAVSDEEHPQRIPFHCHLVDPQIRTRGGTFLSQISAAMQAKNSDQSPLIEVHSLSACSPEFFENVLKPIAKQLNYVVIAIGTDKGSVELAVDIMRCVIKHNEGLDNFRVLVRVYDDKQEKRLNEIANHFNKTTGKEWLHLFGMPKTIFKYNMIIESEYEKEAEEFYNSYMNTSGGDTNPHTSWQDRIDKAFGRKHIVVTNELTGDALEHYSKGEFLDIRDLTLAYEDCQEQPKYKELRKLRRQMYQDMSNAWHINTKKKLLQMGLPSGMTLAELSQRLEACGDDYPLPELIRRLAITEHLRWNASHEMLGYTSKIEDGRCNEMAMTHNCLVSWEQLTKADEYAKSTYIEEYPFSKSLRNEQLNEAMTYTQPVKVSVSYQPNFQSYDYAVVKTTISLLVKDEVKTK